MKCLEEGIPNPSRRYGMIGRSGIALSWMKDKPWIHESHRALRDGSCLQFSRHFMPGYPHVVPTGQKTSSRFASIRSLVIP